MKFTVGTASDDLVDLNGEYEDMPSGLVHFTLPSGEKVTMTVEYDYGWKTIIEAPEGTTYKIDVCSCCDDNSCDECRIMGAGNCKNVCLEHGED